MSETIGSILQATRRAQDTTALALGDRQFDAQTINAFISGSKYPTPQQINALTHRLGLDHETFAFSRIYPVSKNSDINRTLTRMLKAGDWAGVAEFLDALQHDVRTVPQTQAYALYQGIAAFATDDAVKAREILETSLQQAPTNQNLKYLTQATLTYIAAVSGRKFLSTRYRHYLLQAVQKPARDFDAGHMYLLLAQADAALDRTASAIQLIQTGISIACANEHLVVAWRLIDLWAQLLLPDATTNSTAVRLGDYLGEQVASLSTKFKPLGVAPTMTPLTPAQQKLAKAPTKKRKKPGPKPRPGAKPKKKSKPKPEPMPEPPSYQDQIDRTMALMRQVHAKTRPLDHDPITGRR